MILVYPDKELSTFNSENPDREEVSIFLAGTIDNGESYDWQNDIIKTFEKLDKELPVELIIYNPRRSEWDKNASKKMLEEQIRWEQNHLDKADWIIMVLSDNSKSPISLLELGLYASSEKLIVFCTDKFYRYDNVRLTCEQYLIPLINSTNISDIIEEIKNVIM